MSSFTLVPPKLMDTFNKDQYEKQLKDSLDIKYEKMKLKEMKTLLRLEEAKVKREARGLKPNKVTSEDLLAVFNHWLDGNMKVLSKSFSYVYDQSSKENKEVDWVEKVIVSRFYGKALLKAFDECNHPKILLLKNSKRFNKDLLTSHQTLSRRLKLMAQDIDYELIIIEKESKIEELELKLEEALETTSWEYKVEKLLSEGVTQVDIAKRVGKGLATIQRFVKKLKLERDSNEKI
jgi:hypothetical protein